MYSDILFFDDDARMARGWIDFTDHFFYWSRYHMQKGQFASAVTLLDSCLYMYEKYKYHLDKLGLPVHPEQEEAIEATKKLREANARAQKEKEDRESLQRIIEYFSHM